MSMNIIDFYRGQLDSLGQGDKDGFLFFKEDGELTADPVMFKFAGQERQMVLPTYQMIKNGLKDELGNDCHAYHPLCESVLTGESGTIRFLKQAIKNRMYVKGMSFITYLLKALSEGKSSRSAVFKKFISEMTDGVKEPKFDEKLFRSWSNVATYIKDKMDSRKRLMLSIQPDQKVDGEKYIRAAHFTHAFKEEQDDGTATYFGVKLERKQDKVIIHNLLTTVFGWYPESVGSNAQRPYFGSLIHGWAEFVTKFNTYAKGLKDVVPNYELLNDTWIPELADLSKYDGKIQTLPFNTGSRKEDEDTTQRDFRVGVNRGYEEPVVKTATEKVQVENGMRNPLDLLAPLPAKGGNVFLTGGNVQNMDLSKYTPLEQRLIREGRTAPQPSKIRSMSLTEALSGGKQHRQQSASDFFGGNVFAGNSAPSNNPFTSNASSNNPFTSSASNNPFTGGSGGHNPFNGGGGANDGGFFSGMM